MSDCIDNMCHVLYCSISSLLFNLTKLEVFLDQYAHVQVAIQTEAFIRSEIKRQLKTILLVTHRWIRIIYCG